MKTEGRIINNLRYADGSTLMVESKEELKSLLKRVKEESEKAGSKLNIEKLRSWRLVPSVQSSRSVVSDSLRPHELQHARPPCPSPFMANRWAKWKQGRIFFSERTNSLCTVTAAMKLRLLLLGRKTMSNLDSILKGRDITFLTKIHLVKAMVLPVII